MRISDWSSDVCSSDLESRPARHQPADETRSRHQGRRASPLLRGQTSAGGSIIRRYVQARSGLLVVVARAGFLDIGAHEEGPFGHVGRARLGAGQDISVSCSQVRAPPPSDSLIVAKSSLNDTKNSE